MSKSVKGKLAELIGCKAILKKLMSTTYKDLAWIFYDPIDAPHLALHDYHEIIKEPMDLSTVKHRFDSDFYKNATEFASDVRLIFYNAYLYTTPDHLCYQMAKTLQKIFENMLTQLERNTTQFLAENEEMEEDENEDDDENEDEEDEDADDSDEDEDDEDVDVDVDEDIDDSDIGSPIYQVQPVKRRYNLPQSFDDEPLTVEQELDLHAKIQQLDGENLLNVIHIIQQMEDTKSSNKELEFDVRTLKTRTKRSIEMYMASKGITGKRRTCVTTKYQNKQ